MIKTFEEIIFDIKGHQIWKPTASDSRVKEIQSVEFDSLDGILIKLDDNYDSVFIPSDMKFKLQQEEVPFEVAIQAFKEGKEIESVVNNMKYKIESTGERVMYYNNEDGYATLAPNFSLKAIFGKWYIND